MSLSIPEYLDIASLPLDQVATTELLSAIVSTTHDAIIILTPDDHIADWNPGAESMFGFSKAQVLQQAFRFRDLITEDEKCRYLDHIQQLLAGNRLSSLETRVVTRSTNTLDIRIDTSVLHNSNNAIAGIATIVCDITERNAIAQKLEALLDSTPDPFIIVGSDGLIQRVNRQAEKLFGHHRSDMLGHSYKMLIPERFRSVHDRYTAAFWEKPVMRRMGEQLDLWCLSASGEEIPVEIGLSPTGIEYTDSVMVRFRDIRIEKDRQHQLNQAIRKSQQANRIKTRFLAAASHDLRQPLQSISMYLGALEGDLNADERLRIIEHSRMALDSTNQLLNALLNITKLESGRVQPEIRSFRASDLLYRVHNTVSQQARSRSQKLRMPPSTLSVRSDPALLEQLITNLVANAIKYTPTGGQILFGCRRQGEQVWFSVLDTGPGIAPDELDIIFDEYRQLEYDGHHLGKGMGLGLSIVKLIAELLDLSLEVKSVPGRGSSFSIAVPRAQEAGVAQEQSRETAGTQLGLSGILLLIDDDPAVLDSTRLFLELSGLTVLAALNAEQALVTVEEQIPDIIVTDYGLSREENGIQLACKIRQCCGRKLPAIVVTGDTSDLRSQEAHQQDCELLSKPIDAQSLLTLIRQKLGTS